MQRLCLCQQKECVFTYVVLVLLLLPSAHTQTQQTVAMDADTLVIGAGVSGLTAAHRLVNDLGRTVLVLEAADRIGGRTWSVDMKGSDGREYRWDLGGQWVGNTQQHVQKLIAELGLATFPQYTAGMHTIIDDEGKLTRYKDESDMPGSVMGAMDALQMFASFESDLAKVSPADPFKASKANKWNEQTLAEWAESNAWTKEARDTLEMAVSGPMDVAAKNVSALFAMMYLNSAGGSVDVFTKDEGDGAQAFRIHNGAMSIAETLASRLPPDAIRLSHVATSVDQTRPDKVIVRTQDGKEFSARNLILAIPPLMVSRLDVRPPLSEPKMTLMRGLKPKGHAVKAILSYSTPFWRQNGLSGTSMILDTKPTGTLKLDTVPEVLTQDGGTDDGGAALVAFMDLEEADLERRVTTTGQEGEQLLRQMMLQQLKKAFGDRAESDLLEFRYCYWPKQPYVEGAVGTAAPGLLTAEYPQLIKDPTDRIFWAGTETGTVWMGYINGAVQAGERAAAQAAGQVGHSVAARSATQFEPVAATTQASSAGAKSSSGGWFSKLISIVGALI